ncbi:universal stress protein UspA [Paractinoplanes deccanensis]|uniref:Universal stress protein UspA n=1 Tax=Paractinoplanes deccanensis TaxID=113561 RepID=A0ABQ3YEX3_9ACTN|nr:universal stress protein [Actinoplanes deccanensis]GID78475.1 universal stress protein UspA [Actinoplanes deccanensis]
MSDLHKLTRYGEAVSRYLGPAARLEHAAGRRAGLVLVGVDDSPASGTALDHAAIEAELRGWELRLVHAQRVRDHRADGGGAASILLGRMTDRVRARAPSVPVSSRLVTGSPVPLLLVEARKAGLVVVGRSHGAAGALFGASVGERIAAEHTGVVEIVRAPGWPPGPGAGGAPVVVGVDGDDSPAIGFAHGEARVRGCDLVLLRAATAPRAASADTVGGVRMHRRFVTDDPATALIEASRTAGALVVGRHAPGGTAAGMLGAVSRAVARRAHCPVFLAG